MTRATVTVDWDAIKADRGEFARKLLRDPGGKPINLTPAQAEILSGIQRNTTIVTGRQFGKTMAMAIDCTAFAVTHAHRSIFVIAPSLEQGRIIFNQVAAYFRQQPLSFMVKRRKEFPFPEIHLENGTVITARGANSPQYIRGNHAHRVYVDEAAFVKDTVITDVIEPLLLVSGTEPDSALILTSTPFGTGVFFDYAEEAKRGAPDQAYFHFTSADNPYADKRQLERVKARYGENSLLWRTEYLGLFDNDERSVFPWADIKWAFDNYPHGDTFPVAAQDGHKYVQGVDLANLRDYFVASVFDNTDSSAVALVHMDRLQRRGYAHYKSVIRGNYRRYHRAPTEIDATSLGESVVEDLADIHAKGYKFSSQSKWEVVQELARMLSEHRWRIPYNRTVIDEYRYFEFIVTPSKNLKMEASQGHDDIVMSHALAAHRALLPVSIGLFRSVSTIRKPKQDDVDPFVAAFG